MKKMKFTQKVALILLFATLFALLAGCTTPATPTVPTGTDPTDPTAGVPPVIFGGATDFTANLFAKLSGLSRDYSLKIAVSDGKVYVDDIVYEEVNYIDNPGVAFYDAESYWYREEKLSEGFFEKINACKKCYLLETENNRKMVVYDIDGIYYFMRIGNSQVNSRVIWIHYFKPQRKPFEIEIGG